MASTLHHPLEFRLPAGERLSCGASELVIAGWSGRDRAGVERYIAGLIERGFQAPLSIPAFYRASASLVTQAQSIQVLGGQTSGEAEVVLVGTAAGVLVTVGSDHTDREAAPRSVAHAKQLCAKPLARTAWRLADVAGHWDALALRAEIFGEDECSVTYQQGSLSEILPYQELLAALNGSEDTVHEGQVIFCGTLPVAGGIRPARQFRMELADPLTGLRLSHDYTVQVLPVVS